jgi:hypothetical protein
MSTLLRDSINVRKLKAIRRAEIALKQKLDRIEWEERVLLPEVQAMLANKSVLGLPDGSAFEIVVEDRAHRRKSKAKKIV